jgi:hypothetical protein
MNTPQELIISELEQQWCNRMTILVDEDRISDADSLFSEYVIDGEEPDEWLFIQYPTNIY